MNTTTKNTMKVTKEYYTETMEEVTNWSKADMVIMTIDDVNEEDISKAYEKLDKAVIRWCKTHTDAVGEIPTTEKNLDGSYIVSVAATKQK